MNPTPATDADVRPFSMAVVGLDLSLSSAGVAHAALERGVATLKPKEKTDPQRMVEMRQAVLTAVRVWSPQPLVMIEGFAFGQQRGASQAHKIGGLGWIVRVALLEAGIPYLEVAPAALKRFATGKGNANKDEVLIAAVKAGARVEGNDEADAWWLRQMGLAAVGVSGADVPLTAARLEVLDKIDFPEG